MLTDLSFSGCLCKTALVFNTYSLCHSFSLHTFHELTCSDSLGCSWQPVGFTRPISSVDATLKWFAHHPLSLDSGVLVTSEANCVWNAAPQHADCFHSLLRLQYLACTLFGMRLGMLAIKPPTNWHRKFNICSFSSVLAEISQSLEWILLDNPFKAVVLPEAGFNSIFC